MRTLVHILLSAIAVYASARILPGVALQDFGTAVVVSIVLGAANAFLRPLLLILTLPINIATLGLFTFVVIGGLVLLVARVVPGFHVASFWWALAFAFVLSVVNGLLSALDRPPR